MATKKVRIRPNSAERSSANSADVVRFSVNSAEKKDFATGRFLGVFGRISPYLRELNFQKFFALFSHLKKNS